MGAQAATWHAGRSALPDEASTESGALRRARWGVVATDGDEVVLRWIRRGTALYHWRWEE